MTVTENKTETSRVMRIKVLSISRHDLVTVSQHVSLRDWTWGEAMVNWSAVGEVTSPAALDFAQALKVAVAKADEWNRDAGSKMEGK